MLNLSRPGILSPRNSTILRRAAGDVPKKEQPDGSGHDPGATPDLARAPADRSRLRSPPPPLPSGVNKGQREHKGRFRGYPLKGMVWCSLDSCLLLSSFFA